ncbi:MAG TPA: citrate lyase subunit alpha [Clostridiales bacterium]|nr:citrate lyase subunit alpha [Clostridiales bacterium]
MTIDKIPNFIEGYGKTIPYNHKLREIKVKAEEKESTFAAHKVKSKLVRDIKSVLKKCKIKDGMTVSFHHHLRDGDYIINMVMKEISDMGIKNLVLMPSSLQKIHEPLIDYIKSGVISKIYTSGMRGNLAKEISYNNILKNPVVFQTHGGRARAIENGEVKIDIAFIGAPACDMMGNMNGRTGKSAFGSMGYAIVDAVHADKVVAITDNLAEYPLSMPSIDQTKVDYVVVVDEIGDAGKIATGATRITDNETELLIAKYAAEVINETGYITEGFSFQAGSGGSSLAVIKFLKEHMKEKKVRGSFVSGGITSVLVDLLEENYFKALLDTQTFDARAAESFKRNENHIEMSASMYANPYNKGSVVNMLDVVVLSATEVDIDFNVNVLTGSDGVIMGAQGGHPDTADGAQLRVITTPLVRKTIPIIREKVTTTVTPGSNIDIVVTDKGIAVNPLRNDLIEKLKCTKLPIKTIEELKDEALNIAGKYVLPEFDDEIVGIVESRDGSIIDIINKVKAVQLNTIK